ncbi:MAG: nucleotidyltransferase domain-containing protein [Candidatus Thermoplasmatota archaeon]|nr:nucleotidyltransferase domain-containing protein [Candidatus Thermoplasmatota archaeon]MDD5779392.1 nucleotidyltransferase domain-containing protein [Candidatus Thermoplasmatota archaeon]
MAETATVARVKQELGFLRDRVLAVLLFGSQANQKAHPRSDVDLCIVNPDTPTVLNEVFRRVDVAGKDYDVYLFEELPLYMQVEVIRNHVVVFSRNIYSLYEYFYPYLKRWKDQEHRNTVTREDVLRGL